MVRAKELTLSMLTQAELEYFTRTGRTIDELRINPRVLRDREHLFVVVARRGKPRLQWRSAIVKRQRGEPGVTAYDEGHVAFKLANIA